MNVSERERLERMREVWRSGSVSEFELRMARQRYREHRASPRTRPLWFEFAMGISAAAVLLFGARLLGVLPGTGSTELARAPLSAPSVTAAETAAAARVAAAPERSAAASAGVPAPSLDAVRFRASIERGGVEVAVAPGMAYSVAKGENVVVRLGSDVETVTGPGTLEFQLDVARASGWRMVFQPEAENGAARPGARMLSTESVESRPASPPPAEGRSELGAERPAPRVTGRFGGTEAPATAEAGSWSDVAEALRGGDQLRAEAGLEKLLASSEQSTRDSAQLTLAQLWLSQGRRAEATELLRRLADSGETAFIRRRAKELLGE